MQLLLQTYLSTVLFHVTLCARNNFHVVLCSPVTPDPGDATGNDYRKPASNSIGCCVHRMTSFCITDGKFDRNPSIQCNTILSLGSNLRCGHSLGGRWCGALRKSTSKTRMWASAQRDGHPVKYRWHPLFNAAQMDLGR